MGYNYTADIAITLTDTAQAAIALDLDALRERLGASNMNADTDILFASTDDTILDRLLAYLDFDGEILTSTTPDGEHVTVFTGYASNKWHQSIETTLAFLAEHGAGLEIDCRGEDDELWGYRAASGSNTITIEDKVVLMRSEYVALNAAKSALDKVAVALRVRPELGEAGLLAAIKDLQPAF
jgi:hypothetical protein